MLYKPNIIKREEPSKTEKIGENNNERKCPTSIETVEQQKTIIKIIIFAVLDILVFLIPYVIPRLKASILADNANKIYFKIILLILLNYNMT